MIHTSHPVFDIEREIVKAGNSPSPVDIKIWQERIDRIVGKTATGLSRLRIVWGQEVTVFSCGQARMKYPFWRVQDGSEIRDIGIPRFYIEELHTNSELKSKDAWDRARYYWDDGELIDVLGPIPEEGFYSSVFMIAHHDELCCGGREVVRHESCLGAYRPPAELDLERIRRMIHRYDTASNDEVSPSDSLIQKISVEAESQRDERWRRDIREVIEDFMNTHSWKFTEHDPTRMKFGKFHFLSAHNKSGIKENYNASSNTSAA